MRFILRVFGWIATIITPVILILLGVRILLTPLYINVEYRLPGFPEDSYGFTLENRVHWAEISRQYLLNQETISFLEEKNLDDNTSLYNQRELKHMADVKVVVKGAIKVLYGCLLYIFLYGVWIMKSKQLPSFRHALYRGGQLTVGFIFLVLFYLALNFNSLFTNFHRIFFEGDTWLFRYSDTLIRLFPIRFWRDAFIWIAGFALILGLLLINWGRKSKLLKSDLE